MLRFSAAPESDRNLAALGAAYLSNALESPDHHRVMFDAGFELEDADASEETLHSLVRTVQRAKHDDRSRDDVDPLGLATQSWAIGHRLASLVATGPGLAPVVGDGRMAVQRGVLGPGNCPP
ncbi:hypothetical protein FHS41_007402 [Streptomyces violarus]|uniref:HTH-type transcriptional regulator MT1864/Rv1816-like C-terminal domain-containing protein n=1 Tax=Streptomyces violarus TaxID=67380 RepID=A0A7W4ZYE2_9ACTN|nr:TetR-like C-terminal domain-containing protein [Streptomyces violarus]MBB3080848.1 hypothetical protein [Streptomyces violarus]